MNLLVVQSYLLLVFVDLLEARGMAALYKALQRAGCRNVRNNRRENVDDLCRAMDLACVFYPKVVLCLQRSAAATLLLRRKGHGAEMVIGAQTIPFRSHAWVEIAGTIVNDKPYMHEIYLEVERC